MNLSPEGGNLHCFPRVLSRQLLNWRDNASQVTGGIFPMGSDIFASPGFWPSCTVVIIHYNCAHNSHDTRKAISIAFRVSDLASESCVYTTFTGELRYLGRYVINVPSAKQIPCVFPYGNTQGIC